MGRQYQKLKARIRLANCTARRKNQTRNALQSAFPAEMAHNDVYIQKPVPYGVMIIFLQCSRRESGVKWDLQLALSLTLSSVHQMKLITPSPQLPQPMSSFYDSFVLDGLFHCYFLQNGVSKKIFLVT